MAESGGVSPERCAPAGKDAGQTGQIAAGAEGHRPSKRKRYPQARTGKGRSPIHTVRKPGRKRTQGRPRLQASRQRKERPQRGEKPGLPGRRRKVSRQKRLRFPEKRVTLLPETGNALPENMLRFFQKHAALFGKSGRGICKKSLGKRGIPQGLFAERHKA